MTHEELEVQVAKLEQSLLLFNQIINSLAIGVASLAAEVGSRKPWGVTLGKPMNEEGV